MSDASQRRISGWHVLGIAILAFGTIIAVNVYMAWQAISTFPGLEVENSYVASQTFDAERAAQEALGWTLRQDYAGGRIAFTVLGRDGQPAEVAQFAALIGRQTEAAEDVTPVFAREGGRFVAPLALRPGAWLAHVTARAPDGTLFRQRLNFTVPD